MDDFGVPIFEETTISRSLRAEGAELKPLLNTVFEDRLALNADPTSTAPCGGIKSFANAHTGHPSAKLSNQLLTKCAKAFPHPLLEDPAWLVTTRHLARRESNVGHCERFVSDLEKSDFYTTF